MEKILKSRLTSNNFRLSKAESWVCISVLVVSLAVFQDYLFSIFQNTGFYISESLLYNSIWILLAPLIFLEIKLINRFILKNKIIEVLSVAGLSILFTLLHLLIFASVFVAVSYFVFSPTHHFSIIFGSALSNQLYVLILFYAIAPFMQRYFKREIVSSNKIVSYPEIIYIKTGLKSKAIKAHSIEVISSDKPYSAIYAEEQKYVDNRSLKEFEKLLNPRHFARVHRSSIIHIKYVVELTSRQNGDYDARLQNGRVVRLSRHYRSNWEQLLR